MKSARRILGSLTATAALTAMAVFGFVTPAAADVSITPSDAVQGGGVKMTLRVTNESPTATLTKIELQLPAGSEMDDVFPISTGDDGWAPLVNMRWKVPPQAGEPSQPADPPAAEPPAGDNDEDLGPDDLVAEDPATSGVKVPSGITWTTIPGRELLPGAASELLVSMGPLPKADRLFFGVVLTHSDGTVVRYSERPGSGERQAPVLTLRPPRPGEDGAADTHGAPSAEPKKDDAGSTMWWLLGGVGTAWILATVLIIRRRKAPAPVAKRPAATATRSKAPAQRPTKATAQPAKSATPSTKKPAKSTHAARPAKQRAKKALANASQTAKPHSKETS